MLYLLVILIALAVGVIGGWVYPAPKEVQTLIDKIKS